MSLDIKILLFSSNLIFDFKLEILTISILKPIEPGLEKEAFLKELESAIYSELDVLN